MEKEYYKTRREAEKNRTEGARIWFVSDKGYYLIPKKKTGFDKIYNSYDLSKEYHKGYMQGSIISITIFVISFIAGKLL